MDNKEKNFISSVIYVHNAENRLEEFLKSIIEVLEKNFEHSEIVCVNDYSEDKSIEIIKRVSKDANNTSISILKCNNNIKREPSISMMALFLVVNWVFCFFSNDISRWKQSMESE